jgi:hypothetical protein
LIQTFGKRSETLRLATVEAHYRKATLKGS